MRCDEVREELPALAHGGSASLGLRRHLTGCPGCRAEMGRYESLLDSLASMQWATVSPPPGLAESLSAIPLQQSRLDQARHQVSRHVSAHRGVYAGLAVAAVGAAGAALWRSRRHRVALA